MLTEINILKRKNAYRRMINPMALLFFPIILSTFLFAGKAEAFVFQVNGLTASISLDKYTYTIGEPVVATVRYTNSYCINQAVRASISWRFDNTGSWGGITNISFCIGGNCPTIQVQASRPAPSPAGNHVANFLLTWGSSIEYITRTGNISFRTVGDTSTPEPPPPPPPSVPSSRLFRLLKPGNGFGTVVSSPGGINCGPDCQENYNLGTVVRLTATPDPGSVFSGFGGPYSDCNDGVVTINSDMFCEANFYLTEGPVTLYVGKVCDGSGFISSDPGGIGCGDDCREVYPFGTVVSLSASPDIGSRFDGWAYTGPYCSTGVVTLNPPGAWKSVSCLACFSPDVFDLTVFRIGPGNVTSDPPGISFICGWDVNVCVDTASYSGGTVVTLIASPKPGYTASWSGDPDCSDGVVTMNAAKSCTVSFLPNNLTASLSASPLAGTVPLYYVDLTATAGGTQTGDINYTFYCNRSDSGTDITPDWAAKFDGESATTKTAVDACNYATPGTYTGKVIIERGSLVAESRTTITASAPVVPPPSSDFTLSSGSAACNSVPLSWTASSGADGYRILKGNARVDITPYQPYTALNFTDTAVSQNITYKYQIEAYNTGGTNRSNAINVTTPYCLPSCALSGNPLSIYQGQTSTLTWGSISYATSCIASGAWSGSKSISGASEIVAPSPPSATYYLTCSGPGGSTQCLSPVTVNVSPLGLPGWKEIIPR